MKTKLPFLLIFLVLTACSKRLVHTWNIDKFEIIKGNGQKTGSDNIGTITFNKDGKGNKDISYTIFESDYSDKTPFKWEKHEDYILLKTTKSEDSSKLAKAWIVIKDKSKTQVWKSTDGENRVQTLKLSRN